MVQSTPEAASTTPEPPPQPQTWGHPRQLWMLLAVTLGLNFSFYGFRAYLAPYLESFFSALGPAAAQRQADLLSSGFLALMYATPIIGGYIADKHLGEARALALSLWLMSAALVLMASPSLQGFELGMACYALAAGLNITLTVLIGRNYAATDPRRDGAYTLYYLAINIGGFIAPLICADLVGKHFGYAGAFLPQRAATCSRLSCSSGASPRSLQCCRSGPRQAALGCRRSSLRQSRSSPTRWHCCCRGRRCSALRCTR